MPEAQPLGVLVLSGVRHAASYLPILTAQPGVSIRGVCEEPDAPAWAHADGRALAEQFGIPYLADPAAALARDDVHLALVCSEPTRHAPLSIQALQAGKHVLIDKPMATTVAGATAVVEAADRAAGKCSIIHRLYSPAIQRARAWLDAGHIGLVRHMDIEFLANGAQFSQTVERPEFVVDPALSGGGELLNFMGYPIDYVRYLTGAEVVEVYAEAATFFFDPHRRFQVEDVGIVSLKLEHDILATFSVGRVPYAPTEGPNAATLRIIGSHGHLTLDEDQPHLDMWSATGSRRRPMGDVAAQVAVTGAIAAFVQDIRLDRQPLYGPRDAWAAIAAIHAAYKSTETAQPAEVALL